jgi:putative transcriptional regulator
MAKAKTFGQELVESAREALAIAAGEARPARSFIPEKVDVSAIRAKTRMSQERFAETYCLAKGTVRDWEQDRRQPDQAARVLLTMIDRDPSAVAKIIRGAEIQTVRTRSHVAAAPMTAAADRHRRMKP